MGITWPWSVPADTVRDASAPASSDPLSATVLDKIRDPATPQEADPDRPFVVVP